MHVRTEANLHVVARRYDTHDPKKLRIFISRVTPQPSRTAVFVHTMNGAAESSKSQAFRAGSRNGFEQERKTEEL
jgi:hypothetical protein